jgi:CRP-like cAMP-binding protein
MEGVCKNTGKKEVRGMKEGELGRVYSNGEIIFEEGAKGDVMYVIQSGKVKISKNSSSGDISMATLQSGDIFGEMALFDSLPRSASARAEGDARILSIDKKKLFSTIGKDPTVVLKVIKTMSGTIRRLSKDFTELKKKKMNMLCGTMDLEETCTFILEEVRDNIMAAENGSIMLLEEEKDQLHITAAFGEQAQEKLDLAVGEGVAGDVIGTGKAELVNDVLSDSRYKIGSLEIGSLLCVPFKYQGSCFGVLNLSNPKGNRFTLDNLKLLNSFSRYAAIALKNVMCMSDLNHATDQVLKHASILDVY